MANFDELIPKDSPKSYKILALSKVPTGQLVSSALICQYSKKCGNSQRSCLKEIKIGQKIHDPHGYAPPRRSLLCRGTGIRMTDVHFEKETSIAGGADGCR